MAYACANSSLRRRRFSTVRLGGDVHQRQVRIDLPDRFADRADDGDRIADGPQLKDRRGQTRLERGTYMRRRRGSRTLSVLRVAQNADNLELPASRCSSRSGADRVLVREVLAAAASLITTTFGAVWLSRSLKPRPSRIGISIVSKNSGDTTMRLM
jgi:hypothetical protein